MKYQDEKMIEVIKSFLDIDYEDLKSSLTSLLLRYSKQSKRLDVILNQSDKQQMRLIELNEELESYKDELEEKVKVEIEKRQEQEALLHQQAQMAAMGEMMDAIAHQWVQPINVLHGHIQLLNYDFKAGGIDEDYIKTFNADTSLQINHLMETLTEFRNFFRPNQQGVAFAVKEVIQNILVLVQDVMRINNITVNLDVADDLMLVGLENEFKHVVLNIVNNAKDAFIENKIGSRVIDIRAHQKAEYFILEISDNAGGIPEDILKDIFKINFTTKEDGTGIGLYMSSQIVKKWLGTLSAINEKKGAKFTLKTKINI
ncbi:MAG: histidine kinase [Gammaproteobacteria bacterium]|nr:MAG: histidine kinase [Gammaproteobacteria bacterium]